MGRRTALRYPRAMGMDIAIAGAGIGGLAAGVMLAQAGHAVRIYDRFDAPRPVGSGLVIQPVGLAVLDRLGAGDAVRATGAVIERMLGIEAVTGARVLDVRYRYRWRGTAGLAIHRASLFAALWQVAIAAGVTVTPSATVTEAPLRGTRRAILLQNGQLDGPFDLVIDASGATSPLSALRGRPLPYGAIWGTVPWPADTPLPQDQLTQRYRRANRMAGVLPIGTPPGMAPSAAVFWSLPVRDFDRWQATPINHWKAEATTLWPDIAAFLTAITSHAQMTPARYSHGTLRTPCAPALAFIGDAAHRASPQLGQGANMALLDAFALNWALTREHGDAALALYARSRRWHVRLYQMMSAAFTPQYQSDSQLLPRLRDHILAPLSALPPTQAILSRLVSGNLIPPVAGHS